MKRPLLLVCFTLLLISNVFPQRYAFNSIPDELKVGANAVFRTDEMLYRIIDKNNATITKKFAVTILNETASHYRYAYINYNKFYRIKRINASVYDQNGKLVKSLGASDIMDVSAVSGGAFFSDERMKVVRFPLMKYPYTVEYELEMTVNGILNYPTWNFQPSRYASVERSGIQYVVPKGAGFKYYEENMPMGVDSVTLENTTVYTWQVENISAYKLNPYLAVEQKSPRVYATPLDFEIGGYSGSTHSWKDFGMWAYKMIEGRDRLPESEVKKVKELVSDLTTEREKIKKIYEYMQSRTRYVNIVLGIGGWQPMLAQDVSKNGYGDCKALTNYTMALLGSVGIKSYYTLVKSGQNQDINHNFVSNQFDHIILCVPQQADTVWLECTSQQLPFNYLSSFTSDRHVLLIKSSGGELAKTPAFEKHENWTANSGVIKVGTQENSSVAQIKSTYSGSFFGNAQGRFANKPAEGLKRDLNESLNFSTFEVLSTDFKMNKSEAPTAELEYNADIKDFIVSSASRIFFTPSLSRSSFLANEAFQARIYEPAVFVDSIVYELPQGFEVECLPESKVVESNLGVCRYNVQLVDDKIKYSRVLELRPGTTTTEEFHHLRTFFNSIATHDRERVVLKRKGV